MNLSLPEEEITKLLSLIDNLKKSKSASKKDLERLGGIVSHFSSVIRGGRTFCRRIFDLAVKCRKGGKVTLVEEVLLDLSWWENLCAVFNGSANIIVKGLSTSVTTDASSEGFGGWSEGDWFLGSWCNIDFGPLDIPDHVVESPQILFDITKNINVLELFAVVVALRRWGPHLGDSQIHVVTNNTQVVYMVNTGRSANKTCMSYLREIYWLCFIFNVELFANVHQH